MKKTFVALSGLLLLLTAFLTQEISPIHLHKGAIPKSQVILQANPTAEELPAIDLDDKKTLTNPPNTIQFVYLSYHSFTYLPANAFSILFAFLTMVFFQSNYVILFPSILKLILKLRRNGYVVSVSNDWFLLANRYKHFILPRRRVLSCLSGFVQAREIKVKRRSRIFGDRLFLYKIYAASIHSSISA